MILNKTKGSLMKGLKWLEYQNFELQTDELQFKFWQLDQKKIDFNPNVSI